MRDDYYTRDGRGPWPYEAVLAYHDGTLPRLVRRESATADSDVSTVYLALNHGFDDGPPAIFETLVFGGNLDGECERYATEAQALAGHARWVEKVRAESAAYERLTTRLGAALAALKNNIDEHADEFGVAQFDRTELYGRTVAGGAR